MASRSISVRSTSEPSGVPVGLVNLFISDRQGKTSLPRYDESGPLFYTNKPEHYVDYCPLLLSSPPSHKVEITALARDLVVKRCFTESGKPRIPVRRGVVSGFSVSSRRRMLHVARNLTGLTHELVLTYPKNFPCDGSIVKRHWAAMRKVLRRAGIKGFWFLEFQKRGAPHIHVYTTGGMNREQLSAHWYRIVGSGDDLHLRAGTHIALIINADGSANYAAVKEAAKQIQKDVPPGFINVGRFWGCFGVRPTVNLVIRGYSSSVAAIVRIIQRLTINERSAKGIIPFRFNPRKGFCLWDMGPILQKIGYRITSLLPMAKVTLQKASIFIECFDSYSRSNAYQDFDCYSLNSRLRASLQSLDNCYSS